MSVVAQVIAIGRFTDKIAEYTNHDAQTELEEGTPMVVKLFQCETTDQSQAVANALGIDIWEFSEHFMPPEGIRARLKRDQFDDLCRKHKGFTIDVEALEKLNEAGFLFFFMPEA